MSVRLCCSSLFFLTYLLSGCSIVECGLLTSPALIVELSIFAWKIPWMEAPGRLQSMGSLRVGHAWATSLSLSCIGEGNGNPLQCSCLENPSHGGAWWAAVYGVAQRWTRLKWLSSSSSSKSKRAVAKNTWVRDESATCWPLLETGPERAGQTVSATLTLSEIRCTLSPICGGSRKGTPD